MDPVSTVKQSDLKSSQKSKIPINYKDMFQPTSNFYTLIMRMLMHSQWKLWNLVRTMIISNFWHWKMATK